jgi:translation initiation factor 2B subunit (eIF-2B alpha/beta/delta family)
MTGNDTTIISEFEGKLHLLIHEYKQKTEQNRELARLIEEKENALKELQMHCVALENSYNNLKQAKIISLSDSGIEGAKEKITRLVREIDRCIESLKR